MGITSPGTQGVARFFRLPRYTLFAIESRLFAQSVWMGTKTWISCRLFHSDNISAVAVKKEAALSRRAGILLLQTTLCRYCFTSLVALFDRPLVVIAHSRPADLRSFSCSSPIQSRIRSSMRKFLNQNSVPGEVTR